LIDVGPVAGAKGGRIVATGAPSSIDGVIGPWLSGRSKLPKPKRRAIDRDHVWSIRDASLHNLKNVSVDVPLGVLVGITGPSGSGKSSLVDGTLVPSVRLALAARDESRVDKLIAIDQEPIGRSPRSTPASYVGAMPRLRELFSQLPESVARGYKPGRFSSNVKGGRCETCKGEGVMRVEMSFLPDAWVVCTTCNGARFNRETLEIKYRGRSIADVLAMSVDDAHVLFENVTPVRERLAPLRLVGLGYVQVGQPATTLSGGEAQRVKLARELGRRSTGNTLYVLDEPTTGLHPTDVSVLLDALVMLRDQGNSIVVVEHDLDFVACCDWVIDLGPGAGESGGRVVAQGTPEDVARAAESATAPYLARAIAPPGSGVSPR
jgi:excinuclease ABC subunit A